MTKRRIFHVDVQLMESGVFKATLRSRHVLTSYHTWDPKALDPLGTDAFQEIKRMRRSYSVTFWR